MTASRDRILANIRASLATTRPDLERIAASAPHTPPPSVHPPADDLTTQFVTELTRLEGRAHRCATDQEALTVVRDILQEHSTDTVIAWDCEQIGLTGLVELLGELGVSVAESRIAQAGEARRTRLQTLDPVPVCISGAVCAIAESGSLLLLSDQGRGRLASLLAPVHIAVLRMSQLVRGLGDALSAVQTTYGSNPFVQHSNLTIISGPSRTADIELTLTLGVHGPRELHVILIEAEPAPVVPAEAAAPEVAEPELEQPATAEQKLPATEVVPDLPEPQPAEAETSTEKPTPDLPEPTPPAETEPEQPPQRRQTRRKGRQTAAQKSTSQQETASTGGEAANTVPEETQPSTEKGRQPARKGRQTRGKVRQPEKPDQQADAADQQSGEAPSQPKRKGRRTKGRKVE